MIFWKVISLCSLLIYCVSCQRLRLSCEQIRAFVDGHNRLRFKIAQGLLPWQPAAADMKYIVWDEELAEKAARWSEHRIFGHNPDKTIWSRRWEEVGENIFINKYSPPPQHRGPVVVVPNIDEALEEWFGEHKNYGFEPFRVVAGSQPPIGHYTQLVWANSTRVGCGITQWVEGTWTSTLIVCNYGPTGNYLGQTPYARSHAVSGLWCPNEGCQRLYGYYR